MYYFKCPRCGKSATFYDHADKNADAAAGCLAGIFNAFILIDFLIPRMVVALLFSRREPDTECGDCGHIFARPVVPRSSAANLLLWTLLLLFVSIGVGAYVETAPYLKMGIPFEEQLAFVTDYISGHLTGVAAAATVFGIVAAVVAPIVFVVSLSRHRNELEKRYKIFPERKPRTHNPRDSEAGNSAPPPSGATHQSSEGKTE